MSVHNSIDPMRNIVHREPASDSPRLPDEAWLVALASLPAMPPQRLRGLLARWAPAEVWHRASCGAVPEDPELVLHKRSRPWSATLSLWQQAAARIDVSALWSTYRAAGVGVAAYGTAAYPSVLLDDPDPPAMLFFRGTPALGDERRVAIVGTRRCSERSRTIARRLGHDLTAAGVRIVSGLALGVDGAAHIGALDALGGNGSRAGDPGTAQSSTSGNFGAGLFGSPDTASGAASKCDISRTPAAPIGVIASGLDVVYPQRHRPLWHRVAELGLLCSEAPLGTPPTRWRFPERNRVIAALAEVVVVVESPHRGGSMTTVEHALVRGVPVMAVPGPVGIAVAEGTNQLLVDGATPARDADDVLVQLGLTRPDAPASTPRRPPPSAELQLLDAIGWIPTSLAELADQVPLSVDRLVDMLTDLELAGWVASRGDWFERVAEP